MLLPQSCCGLAGLLGCSKTTPLQKVAWDSPREALHTLLAAIQGGDSKIIYESLSEGFKRSNGIDGLSFAVAWEKLRAQVPGLQLAGDAEIVAERASARTRTYVLQIYGHQFEVQLSEHAYWDLGTKTNDETRLLGRYLSPGEFDRYVTVNPARGIVDVRIKSNDLIGVEAKDIGFLKIGTTWRVRQLRGL